MKKLFKNYTKQIASKGFTLIELMVVVAIIGIVSALALFNSSSLNSSVLLSNTAYEVGLLVRDAQISGLGAKLLLTGGVATTSNQGIYFDPLTNPTQIIVFSDFINKDNKYTPGEESQVYNIENKRAGKILSICKIDAGTTSCNSSNIPDLNVVFKRPNPEAYFYYGNPLTEHQGSVVINMGFTGGDCRSIIIYKTGAIQVDKSFCPR